MVKRNMEPVNWSCVVQISLNWFCGVQKIMKCLSSFYMLFVLHEAELDKGSCFLQRAGILHCTCKNVSQLVIVEMLQISYLLSK